MNDDNLHLSLRDESDTRPRRYGWAPGNYLCNCIECGKQFAGDKRACHCAPCAYSIDTVGNSE